VLLDTKSVFLKFKLEIYQLLAAQKRGIYRISFIQQQGNIDLDIRCPYLLNLY
jgi:hypothetical protein